MKNTELLELDFIESYQKSQPMTMTSIERMYGLYQAVRYIVEANIAGDFVECGVWKGGSVMLMAYTLKALKVNDRNIFLFDTFEGMPPPTDVDKDMNGVSAKTLLDSGSRSESLVWAVSPLEEVETNLRQTGYPMERFSFVKGDVMKTIPQNAPVQVALLRLDTDWYESTKHELIHLFPRLSPRGVLIIDDYGHYQGARKAVDEYFASRQVKYLLQRIDYTGRSLVKA